MKKFLLSACAAMLMFTTPVFAGKVFEWKGGQWEVNGYREGNDRSCVASTFWRDGSRINLNVFPDGDRYYTTMTLKFGDWDTDGLGVLQEQIRFVYSNGHHETFKASAEVYGPDTLILRHLSGDFWSAFFDAKTMIIFPGSNWEEIVGLRGTGAAGDALSACGEATGM